MRLNHPYDLRDMLGSAGRRESVSGGSGRSELVGRVTSLKARMPRFVQRRVPSEVSSALLFVAYAWTAAFALVSIVQATGDPDQLPLTLLAALYLVAGLAGLWFGANLIVLIPSTVLWCMIAVANLISSRPNYLGVAIFGGCAAAGIWVGVRSVVLKRLQALRSGRVAEATTNELGWDLYKLSSQLPATDEGLPDIGVYRELRVGELQRHFDQLTSAAIQG